MQPFTVTPPDLLAELIALVQQIPPGRVMTYGDLAEALGDRSATRWVAAVLSDPPQAIEKIAHRVVKATGEPGGNLPAALTQLVRERVPLDGDRVQLAAARFSAFDAGQPLKQLKKEQSEIAAKLCLSPLGCRPMSIAAVDVSYRPDGFGVGAYVLMNADSTEPLWTTTVAVPVRFPYIPGYLSYRELPVHADLLRKVIEAGQIAPLLLVDGNGILHPRRTGIATQLGVLANHPTIGVSKQLLCGTLVADGSFGEGSGRVVHHGETIAAALPPSRRGRRPIFVSPGHRCTLEDAVAVATAWRRGLKLPEPIRLADALSRTAAKAGLERH